MSEEQSKPTPAPRRRTGRANLATARLAAVQALYDLEITEVDPGTVLSDFISHGLGRKTLLSDDFGGETEVSLVRPDAPLLTKIVQGTVADREALDQRIRAVLNDQWSIDRLETVLLAVLRAASFELYSCPDVPSKVVISEYVAIASAFYDGPEPGMINALLDRLARQARSAEFGGNNAVAG